MNNNNNPLVATKHIYAEIEEKPHTGLHKVIQFDCQYQGNVCHKLHLDQYYTPVDVAEKCVELVYRQFGHDITEYYETSAGDGVFLNAIRKYDSSTPIVAIDIEPKSDNVLKDNFLTTSMFYKKGRCFIGNPPFGTKLSLAHKFWKRCVRYGDYIAWILPISQFNSSASLYEFDLITSIDIGKITFSNCKPVHCCFNIYMKPSAGNNNKLNTNLKSVLFMRSDSKAYTDFDYDFRIVCWGGRTGILLTEDEPDTAMVYKLKITDASKKETVRKIIESTDWTKERPSVSCKKLTKTVITKILRQNGVE